METDIENIFQTYAEQNINNIGFNMTNINTRDQEIIDKIEKIEDFKDFKFKLLMNKVVDYFATIRDHTIKGQTLNAHIRSGNADDELTIDGSFEYKKWYLSPINYHYLIKKNFLQIKGNVVTSNNRFETNKGIIRENELSVGGEYSFDFNKRSIFLQNQMFLNKEWELRALIKNSKSEMDIKRNQINQNFKLVLTKNFNVRPFLFREKWLFDRIDQINFEFGNKIIKNQIDEFNCSSELLSKLPEKDSQIYAKLSYDYCDIEKSQSRFKLSSGIVKSLNSIFLKNKIFYRKFFFFNPFVYQFSFEAGNIVPLSPNELRVHERLFINNFKGIKYPSRKTIGEEGKTGDSLGFHNYIMSSHKLMCENLPLFNSFNLKRDGIQITPFVHLNFLLNPKSIHDGLPEGSDYDPLRVSGGVGVSFITQAFSVEAYYNAYVRKNKNEVGTEISFNFGLD